MRSRAVLATAGHPVPVCGESAWSGEAIGGWSLQPRTDGLQGLPVPGGGGPAPGRSIGATCTAPVARLDRSKRGVWAPTSTRVYVEPEGRDHRANEPADQLRRDQHGTCAGRQLAEHRLHDGQVGP
jgi:hypothetical protein